MGKLFVTVHLINFSVIGQLFSFSRDSYHDNFNMRLKHNTDGLIKCLPQPGQLRNQRFTSMLVNSNRLLNFLHRD